MTIGISRKPSVEEVLNTTLKLNCEHVKYENSGKIKKYLYSLWMYWKKTDLLLIAFNG